MSIIVIFICPIINLIIYWFIAKNFNLYKNNIAVILIAIFMIVIDLIICYLFSIYGFD